jgi:hypothetical protein
MTTIHVHKYITSTFQAKRFQKTYPSRIGCPHEARRKSIMGWPVRDGPVHVGERPICHSLLWTVYLKLVPLMKLQHRHCKLHFPNNTGWQVITKVFPPFGFNVMHILFLQFRTLTPGQQMTNPCAQHSKSETWHAIWTKCAFVDYWTRTSLWTFSLSYREATLLLRFTCKILLLILKPILSPWLANSHHW